jgi:hypothetical protein
VINALRSLMSFALQQQADLLSEVAWYIKPRRKRVKPPAAPVPSWYEHVKAD